MRFNLGFKGLMLVLPMRFSQYRRNVLPTGIIGFVIGQGGIATFIVEFRNKFLEPFAKFRKATVTFECLSVCQSARSNSSPAGHVFIQF